VQEARTAKRSEELSAKVAAFEEKERQRVAQLLAGRMDLSSQFVQGDPELG
jgi:hypothetical protein